MAEKRSESTTATREDPQQQQRQKDMARPSRDTGRERALASTVFANPFSLLGRLAEQMTSVFDEVSGTGRSHGRALTAPPEQVSRGRRLEISRGEERPEQRESSPSSKPTST